MDHLGLALVIALVGSNAASADEPDRHFEGPYHIAITSTRTYRATMRSTRSYPNLAAREWWAVFPSPPEFEGQPAATGSVRIADATFAEVARVADESPLRQPLLAVHWFPDTAEAQQSVTAEAVYEVTITRRSLEPGRAPRPVPELTHAERSTFLASTIHFDYDHPIFESWLIRHHLRRRAGERDLDFAYRAMATIVKTHAYRRDATPDEGSASAVCAAGSSNCGGLSTFYATILRANGIPARRVVGRVIKANASHAKVDFYAEGVGWVPADPAASIPSHSADAGFGREGSDMLVTHMDKIRLDGGYVQFGVHGIVRPRNAGGSMIGMSMENSVVFEALPSDRGPEPDVSRPPQPTRRKPGAARRRRAGP